MKVRKMGIWCFSLAVILFASMFCFSCTDDKDQNDADTETDTLGDGGVQCDPLTNEGCEDGTVCEETSLGNPACFVPVVIRGRVFDMSTDLGVAEALVVVRDANGAAIGPVVTTAADGTYALSFAVERVDETGAFVGQALTLRVDAHGYDSYPGTFRPSLPVDMDDAVLSTDGSEFVIQTPTTDVALIPLSQDISQLGSISGNVPEGTGGLVVATGAGGSVTAVADTDGDYTVLNVPAGNYTLNAYSAGHQYDTPSAALIAGQAVADADFVQLVAPTAIVSGSVNIVNAEGGSITSVVLVVEDTFSETFARGEVPPGLRDGEVAGAFTIANVPNGRYVVLAAFENDGLVRDPDTSIGGTQIVHIEISGASIAVPESFKVTEALEVHSPGAESPEGVADPPTFQWADDSSEDNYHVVVYNAFGQLVWEDPDVERVTGAEWVLLPYGGPALVAGMYYQWRATSVKSGVPISITEDLRGLFFLQ